MFNRKSISYQLRLAYGSYLDEYISNRFLRFIPMWLIRIMAYYSTIRLVIESRQNSPK